MYPLTTEKDKQSRNIVRIQKAIWQKEMKVKKLWFNLWQVKDKAKEEWVPQDEFIKSTLHICICVARYQIQNSIKKKGKNWYSKLWKIQRKIKFIKFYSFSQEVFFIFFYLI